MSADELDALVREIGKLPGVYAVTTETDLDNFTVGLQPGDHLLLDGEGAQPVLDALADRLRRERQLELHWLNGQELLESGKFPPALFLALAGWAYAVRPLPSAAEH